MKSYPNPFKEYDDGYCGYASDLIDGKRRMKPKDFKQLKKDSIRHGVFTMWQGMGMRIEELGTIAQNEMTITPEIVKLWMEIVNATQKEFIETRNETLKWLKEQIK